MNFDLGSPSCVVMVIGLCLVSSGEPGQAAGEAGVIRRLGSSSRRTDGACGARSLCLRERRTTMLAGDIARDCVLWCSRLCVCESHEPMRARVFVGVLGWHDWYLIGSVALSVGQSLLCDRGSHHQGNEGVCVTDIVTTWSDTISVVTVKKMEFVFSISLLKF